MNNLLSYLYMHGQRRNGRKFWPEKVEYSKRGNVDKYRGYFIEKHPHLDITNISTETQTSFESGGGGLIFKKEKR